MSESNEINIEYEYRKQRYESYINEREALRTSSLEISSRYDKWILGLAGGALALSVTFMEKIAPNPVSWTFILLGFSWALLIVAIVLKLYAISSSQTAINEELELLTKDYNQYLESLYKETESIPNLQRSENKFSLRTRNLNKWSLKSLTIGIILLCSFSIINLPYKNKKEEVIMSKDKSTTQKPLNESKGSYVPPTYVAPPPPPPKPTSKPINQGGSSDGETNKK